jgi:hypothetical protein
MMIVISSCDKDTDSFDGCAALSSGLSADDAGNAGRGINQLIKELPSADYSGPNLDKLAEKLSTGCGITTTVTCLNCNHTTPLQTELTATYTVNGVSDQKVIIITHTATNKMIFHSMHD